MNITKNYLKEGRDFYDAMGKIELENELGETAKLKGITSLEDEMGEYIFHVNDATVIVRNPAQTGGDSLVSLTAENYARILRAKRTLEEFTGKALIEEGKEGVAI